MLRNGFYAAVLVAGLPAFPRLEAAALRPLAVRSEAVGQLFRLNPPIYGVVAAEDTMSFDVSRTYVNLWARDKRYLIDAEVIDDQGHLAFVPLSWLRLGAGYSMRRFGETKTDQIAISVHNLLMIGQDGRLEAGKHHNQFKIPDYSLAYNQNDRNRAFSEQLTADASVRLWSGGDGTWQIGGTLFGAYEMGAGTPYFKGAVDRGLQLNGTYLWQGGGGYAALNGLAFDSRRSVVVATQKQQLGWAVGAAQRLADAHEVLGQFMVYQPVFRQLGQLSRNSYEVQLGYRYHAGDFELEATVIENIFWLYNSPDWGFSLGLRHDFR